jgi:hypothetical protein
MSQEAVELVRRVYEANESRRFHGRLRGLRSGDRMACSGGGRAWLRSRVRRPRRCPDLLAPVALGVGDDEFRVRRVHRRRRARCRRSEPADAKGGRAGSSWSGTPTPRSGRSRTPRSCVWSSPHSRRSPRSRGAAGVGDVAGQACQCGEHVRLGGARPSSDRPLRPEPSARSARTRLVPGSASAGVRVGRD